MKTHTFLVFVATFVVALHSTNAQLIINGGFETPDTATLVQINAGQNTLAPWIVGLHSVEVGDAVGNGFITGPAFEGAQFLDLNGLQRGRLTQTFATSPGSLYTITFAYTDNYYEPASPAPASATVRVFDDSGDRLKRTITHTGAVAGDYHWTVFNGQFTARQTTTRLEFTSLTASLSGHSGGIMLDAVHVSEDQLIINGGFESPDTATYMQINAGQNTLAPWVVGLHSVEVGDAVGNGFITGPAFEGAQFLDLNGLQRGRLTQAFATTPGSLYTVTFAYTDNYYEPSAPAPASATVRLFDDLGDRLNQTITHAGAVDGNYHWTVFNEQFTALRNTTSLEFTSLTTSPSGHSGGIMLDAVQVLEGAPLKILSITHGGNGSVALNVRGIPKGLHRIQASVDLSGGSFIGIATVTADPAGLFHFQTTPTNRQGSFYRVLCPMARDWRPAVSADPGGINGINTASLEGCPIESPDGLSLFFASDRAGGQGAIDIWRAGRDAINELWRNPLNVEWAVNSAFDDVCPTPIPGGHLFFVSRRPGGCSENSADIWLNPMHGLGPVMLPCELNSAGDELSPSYVQAEGGTLFFSSNRDGMHKIYAVAPYALYSSAGEPEEVAELNAPGFNTFRPNVSEDGLEIVFDSDRPGGLGGLDIWSATRASVFDPWSAPVNLGSNVNSDSAESRASLSRDSRRLTFGSTRPGGQGSSDIYVSTR